MRRKAGFTLLELMVVIVIMGVLVTAVMVNLEGTIPTFAVRASARKLGAAAEQAWSYAVLHGKPYALMVDLDQGAYQILLPENRKGGEDDAKLAAAWDAVADEDAFREELGREVKFESLQVPTGDTESSGVQIVEFDPYGNRGSFILGIHHGDGATYWVKFNGLLGQASFSEEKPEFRKFGG